MTEKLLKITKSEVHAFSNEHITDRALIRENDKIISGLSEHEFEKWKEAINICRVIAKNFCNEYNAPYSSFTPLLSNTFKNGIAANIIRPDIDNFGVIFNLAYFRLDLKAIVKILVHETLGHAILARTYYTPSRTVNGVVHYFDAEYGIHSTLGEPLNEAIIDLIATEQTTRYFNSKIRLPIELDGYCFAREKLGQLRDTLSTNNDDKQMIKIFIATLRQNAPQLIISYIYKRTGIEMHPKKLLNMEIDEYIDQIREVFEQRKIET
jgi:hypothetical protein